mgnify:CR=1 FL=1
MAKKFTFKYQPHITGLAGVGNPLRSVDIKFDGEICGVISAPNWQTKDNLYRIRLTVKKPGDSSKWKWIQLKFKSENEKEVRSWLKENTTRILEQFDLYFPYQED